MYVYTKKIFSKDKELIKQNIVSSFKKLDAKPENPLLVNIFKQFRQSLDSQQQSKRKNPKLCEIQTFRAQTAADSARVSSTHNKSQYRNHEISEYKDLSGVMRESCDSNISSTRDKKGKTFLFSGIIGQLAKKSPPKKTI